MNPNQTSVPARLDTAAYRDGQITRWRVGASTFIAIPERGARLLRWEVARPDGTMQEVIYWPARTPLAELPVIRGGNPILFPFCARSFVDGEIFFWRDHAGTVRPMPLHGIARQSAFRVTRLSASGFSAVLVPDATAREAYPYDYDFTVRYRFEAQGLRTELELFNRDQRPIPWSAGHHFYITLPWSRGLQRKDYTVDIPSRQSYRQDAIGMLQPGPRFARRESLDNSELSATMHCGLEGNEFFVTEQGTGSRLRIVTNFINTDGREAAFTTWTGDDESPYYCFEPWMGPPNAPETRIGLHHVPPGESQKFCVDVMLEPAGARP